MKQLQRIAINGGGGDCPGLDAVTTVPLAESQIFAHARAIGVSFGDE